MWFCLVIGQGPDQSSPPTAAAAAAAPEADKTRERERTLVTLPKTLRIGDVKQTMLSAVERWVTKTLEEKDEAVRWGVTSPRLQHCTT